MVGDLTLEGNPVGFDNLSVRKLLTHHSCGRHQQSS
jgi:hypothetical protein